MNRFGRAAILAASFAVALRLPAADESTATGGECGWRPLPGYYGEGHLERYHNQRGYEQAHRYETALDVDVGLELLSKDSRDFLILETHLQSAFGRSVAPLLPFSPMDAFYGVSTFWERRRENLLYRAGWDHACYHLILQKDEIPWYERDDVQVEPVTFYNRVFAGTGTPTVRRAVQRARYRQDLSSRPSERLIWYTEGAVYLHETGGLLPPGTLSRGAGWRWDATVRLGYPLWANPSHALVAGGEATALVDLAGRAHWRGRVEMELMFNRTPLGASLFGAWTPVDQQPYHGREGLIETGIRFIL